MGKINVYDKIVMKKKKKEKIWKLNKCIHESPSTVKEDFGMEFTAC